MPNLRTTDETTRSPVDGTELVRLATTGANWKATLASMGLAGLTAGSILFASATGNITQDNATFYWNDTNNRISIGGKSLSESSWGFQAALTVHVTSDWVGTFARWVNNSNAADFTFAKSRGASVGTHAIVQNADLLGSLWFAGDDGASFQPAAAIRSYVDGVPGLSDIPGVLTFETTPDGSASTVERMRIDSGGRVTVGSPGSIFNSIFEVHSTTSGFSVSRFSANAGYPLIHGYKSRGASIGTNTIVQSGDGLFAIDGWGYDGAAYQQAAAITMEVDGTPGANDMPGRITFWTTPDGSTSIVERMRIDNAGTVIINAGANYTPAGGYFWLLQNTGVGINHFAYSSDAAGANFWTFKSRNFGIVQNNDYAGSLVFTGSDGTNYIQAARIDIQIDGTPGVNDMPGRIMFSTTPDASVTPAERMRIDNQGVVSLSSNVRTTSSTTGTLVVTGGVGISYTEATPHASDTQDSALRTSWMISANSATNELVGRAFSVSGLNVLTGGGHVQALRVINAYSDTAIGASTDTVSYFYVEGTNSGTITSAVGLHIAVMPGSNKYGIYDQVGTDWVNAANGRLTIGDTAIKAVGGNFDQIQSWGTDVASGGLSLGMFSATAANGAHFDFYRSKNATLGSATVVAVDDVLGEIYAYGAQQTGTFATQSAAAKIQFAVDGTATSGAGADMPGRVVFFTTPDASGTPAERMRIDSFGNVVIGAAQAGQLVLGGFFSGAVAGGGGGSSNQIQNWGSSANTGSATFGMCNATAGTGPHLDFYRSKNATVGQATVVATDDVLGEIYFSGAQQTGTFTNSTVAAKIQAAVDGTVTSGAGADMPGRIVFFTTPDASGTVTEALRINKDQQLSTRGALRTVAGTSSYLQVNGSGGGIFTESLVLWEVSTSGATLALAKSRNNTVGSHTIVSSGDQIGGIEFLGSNGTDFAYAAEIKCFSDGTPGASNDMPGRLGFYTSADASATPTERLRIDNAGQCFFPSVTTTAGGGSAARLDNATTPANKLLRDTSSLRFKTAIEDVPIKRLNAALDMRVIEFASLCAADNPEARFVGLGAEDVAEVDPALVAWGRDYDSGPLLPMGVQYERVNLLRTEALKLRCAMLEEKIKQLEERLS